jgi:hypothetical protein
MLANDGSLDIERSFRRVNYLPRLAGLAVKNNVQANVGSHPVDFVALRIPKELLAPVLPADSMPDSDAVCLYGADDRQVLILSRHDSRDGLELRYLPVRGLQQDTGGNLHLELADPAAGLPLRIFEDAGLGLSESERSAWLSSWHSELEWLHATHRTRYSNSLLALHEQFLEEEYPPAESGDKSLMKRFQARRRRLAEPDFLIFANDHWNFNVRGFNPGGNHGSLLRISTHSVLMLAGGAETGIPQKMVIEEPYDSLSFVPTIMELMGLRPDAPALPGRPVRELLPAIEKAGGRP